MVVQRQAPFLILLPVKVFRAFTVLVHADAVFYRANQFAEVTSYAFLIFYGIGIIGFTVREVDSLVRTVFAGDIAQPAVNAFILVNVGDNVVVNIQFFPFGNGVDRFADEVIDSGKTFFVHPVVKPFAKVFYDAEAMFHGGGAYLYAGGAK